ncbi:MAG: hypothetical protein ACRDG7_07385 [Candidatus Limnocylindria bacterium]
MLGEPEFDVAPFLWNPIHQTMTLEVAERRLAAFAAAGLDEQRMRVWSVIRGWNPTPFASSIVCVPG